MKGETAERLVLGVAVVTAVAALYNLVTLPSGDREGFLGAVERAQETFEWAATATMVNSVVFLLVAVALGVLATKAEFE